MEYFRSAITGKIVTHRDVWSANDIFGKDKIEELFADGTLEPVAEPSVIDCVSSGSTPAAMARYCEIHNCDMNEAKTAIQNIRTDYYRIHNARKKNRKAHKNEQKAV